KIHGWRGIARLITGWDIGFAQSYMSGDWSSPDLFALLNLACRNACLQQRMRTTRPPHLLLKLRHALNRNTRRGSRRNIVAHYDLGNAFYEQWLDRAMNYSSALFSSSVQTLEEAQHAKLDRVIELMNLSSGDGVLEIGCGWGGLAQRIVSRHDCALT